MLVVFVFWLVGLTIFLMGYSSQGKDFEWTGDFWRGWIAWFIALLFL